MPRPLLSRAESQAIDRKLIEQGVPGIVLMENAGRGAAELILKRFAKQLACPVIVGGPGQNGGDAWVVARHLRVHGFPPRCFLVADPSRVRGDSALALSALRAIGIDPTPIKCPEDLQALLALKHQASLIIDGLFGTGLDRPIDGIHRLVIEALCQWPAPKVALDIPSGVCAESGGVLGVALPADLTITFHAPKRGLHHPPGLRLAGEVVTVDIGVPPPPTASAWLIGLEDARGLSRRPIDAHKGTGGHVLVIGGSPGKTGAALLASRAALRAGAGLVTIAPRPEARPSIEAKVLEAMTLEFSQEDAVPTILEFVSRAESAVLGPGLGLDPIAKEWVERLAIELPVPTVIDADALRLLNPLALRQAVAPRILTPHPGEAASMLGSSIQTIQSNRFAAAQSLVELSHAIVVLKGARSIIASRDCLFVCERGSPALGTAGSGDVLAGIIAALLAERRAQDLQSAFEAAWLGVLLHAVSGERAAQGSDRGLLASQIADALPSLFAELLGSAAPHPHHH